MIKLNTQKSEIYLASGYLMIGFSIFYRLINIITTYYSGEKITLFDILNGVLKNLAEAVILTLLIAISWGWSITHTKFPGKYKIVVVIVALLNLINVILWHSMEEIEETYHQYEEPTGILVLVIRLAICAIFVVGCLSTSATLVGKPKYFMGKILKLGSLYLFSWPVAVVISEALLPKYLHNYIITIVEEYSHLIANAYICWLFAYPESEYKKINLKKDDDALPEYVRRK